MTWAKESWLKNAKIWILTSITKRNVWCPDKGNIWIVPSQTTKNVCWPKMAKILKKRPKLQKYGGREKPKFWRDKKYSRSKKQKRQRSDRGGGLLLDVLPEMHNQHCGVPGENQQLRTSCHGRWALDKARGATESWKRIVSVLMGPRKICHFRKDNNINSLTSLGVKPQRFIKGKYFLTWGVLLPMHADCEATTSRDLITNDLILRT